MEKKIETFEEYGIKVPYRRRNGNVKCVCPNCKNSGRSHPEDKSLSVNLDTGVWHCHYCGWSGGLRGYEGRRILMKKSYRRPSPLQETGLSQKLINYCSLRGISLETLQAMHIAEGKEFMPQAGKEMNTVQFPYYLEGELINVKYRTGDKKFKMVAGAELIPYNIDGIKDKEEAIIVEGEWDALSFIEAGIENVVSVPNGANANLEWLDDFMEGWFDDKATIYIAVDNDEKGLELRDELVRRFGAERCMVVEWSAGCKDANDQLKEFGSESLRNCVTGAHEVKVGGIYSLADYENELDAMWRHGLQRGRTIGHENFDKLVSFETKRLMVVTGVPGCLDGDSAVLMSDGTTKPIRDVQVGDDVMALDKDYRLVTRPVVTKWDSGEKMCYKLTTDKGRTLIATGDHKILSFDGMKPLKELKVGEFIGSAGRRDTPYWNYLTEDMLRLTAIWIAEGNKSQNTYIVSNGNKKIVELMRQICERNNLNFHNGAKYEYIISTRKPLKCDRKRYISSMSYYFRQKHGVDVETSIRMASEKYEKKMAEGLSAFSPMEIIKLLGLKGATTSTLFVPDEIKRMNNDAIALFLNVLISCDGCISSHGLEYSSNSQQLCRDIQDLLARFGINAQLRHKNVKYNGTTRDHYVLYVAHYSGVEDFAARIGLVGHTEKLERYLQEHHEAYRGDYVPASCKKLLPHNREYYKEKLGLHINKRHTYKKRMNRHIILEAARHENMAELVYKLDNSCLWEQVKSIEPVGVRHTYDIQVAIDHNFIANSLIIKNSGKSEFIDEMVVRLNVRYGWKTAFFSPENLPMKYHASKIIEKLTGKKFSESTMSAQEYEAAKHYYSSNFKHILPEEKYTLDAILDKAKFLVRRNGIKVLVIDPYNRIESDIGTQSETNYISKILDQLTNFAQRNDVLVCLMAHPRKINRAENADGIPTFYDINGSANFYNKADFGLIVHRNRDEGYTLVRVAKVKFRHLGENGDALFKYNVENGRYVPYVEGQPVVMDNRSYLDADNAADVAQHETPSTPMQPGDNYDFLSDVGNECPF